MVTWPHARNGRWPTAAIRAMQKISAYILTYNEAEKIEAAVASVLWADEVVVVDSFSTDRTAEIADLARRARGRGARSTASANCATARSKPASHEWIFSLDADERCTREVRDEILALLPAGPPHDVYRVPRRSYMMGRWIRGSGWYPNFRQPQLFRKGACATRSSRCMKVTRILSGKPLGTLTNAIWQFPFRNLRRGHRQDEPLFLARRAASSRASACRWRARSATACGRSSSTTSSSSASSTAGPASSSRSAISRARSTATPSATRRRKTGSRRRSNAAQAVRVRV